MLSYFRYIELNLIKKKSVWVGAGVFWLYILLLLLIVPAILHMGPLFIWSNTIFDLQSYLIIIFAIICGITAVVIFNDPKDDGSELIIISKPNNRWKMIITKFICFLVHNFIVLAIGMIMMLFTLCFGRISITNPNGIDFAKLPGIEWTTLLGSLIIILIFGSIAILISILSGKIGILVGTIGFAITINVLYLVAPAISKSQSEYLRDKYDIKMDSYRYLNLDMNEIHNATNASFVTNERGTLYYTNDASKHSTNAFVSYANIAQQMTSVYKIDEHDAREVQQNGAFGSNVNYKYTITNQTPLLKQELNYRPLMILKKGVTESAPRVDYIIPSVNLSDLQFYSMAGANANCMFYIWQNTNLLQQARTTRFFDVRDLIKYKNEPSVMSFFNGTILNKYGPDKAWDGTNEEYADFHDDIGTWLLTQLPNGNTLTEDLGCPINTGDPFNDSYNMTIGAFKLYLLLLQNYSTIMYEWFDNQTDINLRNINNHNVLINWFASANTRANNIINRWNRFFANDNEHWAYNPQNQANHYYWMIDDNPNQSWIVTLMYSTLSSLNDTSDGNGDIVNQIYNYEAKAFYTPESVMIFWTTFSLVLFTISVLIYAKTDIK